MAISVRCLQTAPGIFAFVLGTFVLSCPANAVE